MSITVFQMILPYDETHNRLKIKKIKFCFIFIFINLYGMIYLQSIFLNVNFPKKIQNVRFSATSIKKF